MPLVGQANGAGIFARLAWTARPRLWKQANECGARRISGYRHCGGFRIFPAKIPDIAGNVIGVGEIPVPESILGRLRSVFVAVGSFLGPKHEFGLFLGRPNCLVFRYWFVVL